MTDVLMAVENDREEQEVASRWSTRWRMKGRTGIIIIVFLLLSGVVTISALLLLFSLSEPCNTKEKAYCHQSLVEKICLGAFLLIFVVGGFAIIVLDKRRRKRSSKEVAVSEIPTEDLEKSPSPVLPYNHIPHRSPFGEASSIGLPEYFIAVQNDQEVSSQLNKLEFWTEDIDADSDDETDPPPCYEEALKMTTQLPATATDQETHKQGNSEVTRL